MISAYSYSEAGGHDFNEDAFSLHTHPLEPECWVCVIADGQGGQSGGGPAAQLASQTALTTALALPPERLIKPASWINVVRTADRAVAGDRGAGFTTLVGLCVYGGRIAGASNGDSAAILITEGRPITLTARQRKNPPVGSGAVDAVSFAAATKESWKLLAMSDGVWKYVGWERLVETMQSGGGRALIDQLQRAARLPGNGCFQDDFTVVLLEASAPNH